MEPKDKTQIHIYCTDELRKMVEILAVANDRTVAAQVRVLIASAYAEHMEHTKNNLKG